MREYSKQVKVFLREYTQKAQEEELRQAILKLEESIGRWHKRQIDIWELSELIHKYDTVTARQIYGYYRDAKPDSAVARAIMNGFLNSTDMPAELLEGIRHLIDVSKFNVEK